jgi:dTDP-4-dehydrorhamnose reductase
MSASQGILLALEKTTGIIHLGGKERISRYDFGVMLAEIGNFDIGLIVPKLQQEIKFTAPRPADVSLDSSKAFSLGYSPDNIKKALSKLNCLSVK